MLHWLFLHTSTVSAVAGCAFAIWKGGHAERAGGLLIGGAWLAAFFIYPFVSSGSPVPYVPFAIDGFVAFGLLCLALRYSSAWLGMAVLVQAAELALTATFLTGDGSGAVIYFARVNVLGVALILLLLVATVRVWVRRLRSRPAADKSARAAENPAGEPFEAATHMPHPLIRR